MMYKNEAPVIKGNKQRFFREQLYRELTQMFKWENVPSTIAVDYLERNLIRYGNILYYEDEDIGQDVLRCSISGYNRHEQPVSAYTFSPNTIGTRTNITRNLKRLSDGPDAIELFNPKTDGVLIQNMEFGQDVGEIVEHYSERMAMVQQAMDTNLLWSNLPYIFLAENNDTKLSIEKMFRDIFKGKPAIILDKQLTSANKDRSGVPTGVPFQVKELMDVMNEINMQFRQTVGFDTAGVDKAERVNTLEVESNGQHTSTVLDIMLQQRELAVENINAFFGTDITVSIGYSSLHEEEDEEEEDDSLVDERAEYNSTIKEDSRD